MDSGMVLRAACLITGQGILHYTPLHPYLPTHTTHLTTTRTRIYMHITNTSIQHPLLLNLRQLLLEAQKMYQPR